MLEAIANDLAVAIEERRKAAGLGYESFPRSLGISVGSLHGFLRPPAGEGRPPLGITAWRALYRAYPQLRWLLEEYQRQSALDSPEEVTEPGPPRRVPA